MRATMTKYCNQLNYCCPVVPVKWLAAIIACLLAAAYSHAQTPVATSSIDNFSAIRPATQYLFHPKAARPNDLAGKNFLPDTGAYPVSFSNFYQYAWFRFSVINDGFSYNDTLLFYPGDVIDVTIYETDTAAATILPARITINAQLHGTEIKAIPLHIPQGATRHYLVQAHFTYYNWRAWNPMLTTPQQVQEMAYRNIFWPLKYHFIFTLVFLGILLTTAVYFLIQYFLKKLREYLYYALYAFVFTAYLIYAISLTFNLSHTHHALSIFMAHASQMLGHLLYIAAAVYFLDIKRNLPHLMRVIRVLVTICIAYCCADFFIAFNNATAFASYLGFIIIRIVLLGFSLYAIYILFRWKNPFGYYFIAGAAGITIFGALSLLAGNKGGLGSKFFFDLDFSLVLFEAGIMIELLCFSFGLGHKAHKKEMDDVRMMEALSIENEKKEFEKYRAVMQMRDQERNRIAQEIHDDIGAGLTSIRLLSEIARARSQEHNNQEMGKISDSASQLVDKMNEIVWSLNSMHDTLPHLVAYIRSHAVEYFEPYPIRLELLIPDEVPGYELSGEYRRNIFLVVKEALHNILKHAGATYVRMSITVDTHLRIMIADNGTGFNQAGVKPNNMGLRHMRERMEHIGGKCSVLSQNGTIITISFPLIFSSMGNDSK
jgi:signal transduction histidine kinase